MFVEKGKVFMPSLFLCVLLSKIYKMTVDKSKAVFIEYVLKNAEGELIDTTEGRGPLGYIHGFNYLIAGLENELNGKKVGDKFDLKLGEEEAYGPYDTELVYIVPKANFEGGEEELEIGMQVEVNTNQDGNAIALVTNIEGEEVTLDLNHPLAGEELNFSVEVVNIREASQDELDHGHVHGEGGVHH